MRFFVDVLTGVPSIIFGLFIYIVLIVGTGSTYAGYKGAFALSLLMLPVVIRSAEVVLLLVPGALRESALALGAPRWRVIFRIVLPTALPGMVTGVLLAIARAAGRDRAAAVHRRGDERRRTSTSGGFMNSLPVQIYNDVTSPTTAVVNRAWGAALTLVVMILAAQPRSPVSSREGAALHDTLPDSDRPARDDRAEMEPDELASSPARLAPAAAARARGASAAAQAAAAESNPGSP